MIPDLTEAKRSTPPPLTWARGGVACASYFLPPILMDKPDMMKAVDGMDMPVESTTAKKPRTVEEMEREIKNAVKALEERGAA